METMGVSTPELSFWKGNTIAEKLRDLADQIEKLEKPPQDIAVCLLWTEADRWGARGFVPNNTFLITAVVQFFESLLMRLYGEKGEQERKSSMN